MGDHPLVDRQSQMMASSKPDQKITYNGDQTFMGVSVSAVQQVFEF
jgi:hypothetical protein